MYHLLWKFSVCWNVCHAVKKLHLCLLQFILRKEILRDKKIWYLRVRIKFPSPLVIFRRIQSLSSTSSSMMSAKILQVSVENYLETGFYRNLAQVYGYMVRCQTGTQGRLPEVWSVNYENFSFYLRIKLYIIHLDNQFWHFTLLLVTQTSNKNKF